MSESASESIGEVHPVTLENKRKPKAIAGFDPGPHLGCVVLQKGENGYEVKFRWTFDLGEPAKGDVYLHWARKCAELVCDPNVSRWLESVDVVVIERQYMQNGVLPSFLIMTNLCSALETKWPGKTKLVGSMEVKAAYFTEAQRKNYNKRKQVAELMTKDALARATIFDPTHRVHDQADAFLVVCYYVQFVLKRSPEKLSAGYRKPKVVDAPRSKDDEEYLPKRRSKRKAQ